MNLNVINVFIIKFFFIVIAIVSLPSNNCFANENSHYNTSDSENVPNQLSLPGAEPYSKKLQIKLNKLKEQRGKTYQPRTKHLFTNGSAKFTNRLFLESSPYLLQHAHNPVNWYPWSDEAFETAKRLNRPILLSIGYSTCHWCHVMEEESFEDLEIAKYLNENYIAIKVDREERPDLDSIYMVAVQAITGRGGWPMNTWLTHERKPFYGGTYFPARDGDRGIPTGFLSLLKQLKHIYDSKPELITQQSQQLTDIISGSLEQGAVNKKLPSSNILHDTYKYYKSRFDSLHGGLKQSPKFPSDISTRFLLRYHKRTKNTQALEMATLTLRKMAAGGIYDQIGGGFHRYSTDENWIVPHFEKMLYDNALQILAYLEAYQLTGDEKFLRVTKEILRYIERDMTSSEGAFYSATDADSLVQDNHREEGYYFTWTPDEFDQILSKEASNIVKAYFAVTDEGNFEGRNILHITEDEQETAKKFNIPTQKLQIVISDAKEKLYQYRNNRPRPIRDEKILTAWNGLMISAFARAGLILAESKYIDIAKKAAEFIKTNLHEDSELYRSFKDGMRKYNAYLEDYAFYIAALLDLYEATHNIQWLNFAIELDKKLLKSYEDTSVGGFFMTSDNHEQLLTRIKPYYDTAEPSGNSVAALNLLRLYEFTSNDSYRKRADQVFMSVYQTLSDVPQAHSEMLIAVDYFLDNPKEIVIVTTENNIEAAEPFIKEFRKTYLPNKILVVLSEGENQKAINRSIPLTQGKLAIDGRTTAYVCEKRICKLPTAEPRIFAQQIAASKN